MKIVLLEEHAYITGLEIKTTATSLPHMEMELDVDGFTDRAQLVVPFKKIGQHEAGVLLASVGDKRVKIRLTLEVEET